MVSCFKPEKVQSLEEEGDTEGVVYSPEFDSLLGIWNANKGSRTRKSGGTRGCDAWVNLTFLAL